MTPPRAEARGLVRRYGSRTALGGVDLVARAGEVLAVFGHNGAGKTTLLGLLSLTLRRHGGSLTIDGLDPGHAEAAIKRRIGVLAHRPGFYPTLSGLENLLFFASLHGVEGARARAAELLDRFELADRADDPVGAYSRGLVQRLGFARALMHRPSLLLLDEPFTGLDPEADRRVADGVRMARAEGAAAILVTHRLERGLALSDRWMLLARGRQVASGSAGETTVAAIAALFESSRGSRPGGEA